MTGPADPTGEGTHYVAGFLFNPFRTHVALVRKNRPGWQAGKLNGIGGHIEVGEDSHAAMVREFEEEAGLLVERWRHFATVQGPWGSVRFFRAFTPAVFDAQARTDEAIEVRDLAQLAYAECLPNLSWLVPLALYTHDRYAPVVATENGRGPVR